MDEDKIPIPGSFVGPEDNSPRLPRKEIPEEKKAEESGESEDASSAPLTPEDIAKQYSAGLAEVGLTVTSARSIMEEILIGGKYEDTTKIGPVLVTLRTRNYKDTVRTNRYLELENPTYNMSVQDLVARFNIAASLVSYGDKIFEHPDPEESEDTVLGCLLYTSPSPRD